MKEKNKILTTKAAVIYALGIFGIQFFIGFMNSFQTEFYNKMYSGFDGNIFYASAIIILVAKIISCVFDPVIGGMIDKSNKPGGKMRPWILRSLFPLAILTTLIFIYIPFDKIPGAKGKILLYGYITITTVLWNIAMSFADIPSSGMLSLLSPDVDERNTAAGFANLTKSAALGGTGVVVTVVMLVLNLIKGEGNYPDSLYYMLTAVLIAVLGIPLGLLMYFTNKETVKSTGSTTGQFSFKDIFAEFKENKQILLVFLLYMLGFARGITVMVCVQANGALVGKLNLFGMTFDTTADATWLPGLLGGITGVIGFAVVPKIHKKFGTKKTYIMYSIGTFVCAAIFCIFYWLLPADSPIRYGVPGMIYVAASQFFMSFLTTANTYIPLIMTADIVDYEFERTGKRKEGINYAVLSLAIKLSNAFAVALGLLLIAFSGYTQVMYESGVIPVRTQNIMVFDYIGVVGVSALLSIIPMFFYKVDKTEKV